METLAEEIINSVNILKDVDSVIRQRYMQRVQEGFLTRDENPATHFCVYFLPFHPATKQVFLVHHKKANKWISPGGHIDKEESLQEALNREIGEELGVKNFFSKPPQPFLLTITHINEKIACKEHLDIWFLLKTDGLNFKVDPQEFYKTGWFDLTEAKQIIGDNANFKAILSLSKQ